MPSTESNDQQAAHRRFAVQCFNQTWSLLEQPVETPADRTRLLSCAMTSLWHWTQRDDVTSRHLSVGCWQVSRVLAVLNEGALARHFAMESLQHSQAEEPFYQAYAHEALARAASVLGDHAEAARCLNEATRLAESVADPSNRQPLLDDLQTIVLP